uniref:Septin-type G domain-containing protein n=1 Tax=Accipiter nisus TaxID=211598 RepID=A0A8B9NJK7_9AVES
MAMGFVAPLRDRLYCPKPFACGVGDGCGSGPLPWLSPGTAAVGAPCAIAHAETLRASRQGATGRLLPTVCLPPGSGPPANSFAAAVHLFLVFLPPSWHPLPVLLAGRGVLGGPGYPRRPQGAVGCSGGRFLSPGVPGAGCCPHVASCKLPGCMGLLAVPTAIPWLSPGWWLVPWGSCVPPLLPSLPSLGCMCLAAVAWVLVMPRWLMPPQAGTATIGVISSLVPQIKRFLKEDSEEAELTQLLRDCPPADSPRKVEPPESWREPGHPLCGVGRVPPDEPADERDARIFSRSRPLDFQQHIAAPPSPSPNRPRSPWGQLDPYDSSEDDKEYVGFATLPNQVHRKSVKKGFDFTLMVAGESGLGKSTLVNSLFLTDMYRDRKLLNAEERITQTVEITKHVVDIEEKGVKLRLTIVDTPGFGDAVNNTECWKPVADYIDQQFEQYFRDESGLNRKNIQDNRVHCCIYFISPFGHGLRPLDVEFMRALHQRVNIVPVLAKADTLTPAEVERMKNKIREEIDHYGIRIYQFPECDSDEDEEFKLQDQALKESIPFAVIGSNTVVEAKGRRVRGRLYPWGIVEVENPSHCDFVKLRTMLVRTHMQDLKDVTRETHYENYRTQCIQSMTRMVVKERNRNKLTRESGTDFPIPVIPPVPDAETEKLIREKDEELRRMQEMLQKIQKQMKDSH